MLETPTTAPPETPAAPAAPPDAPLRRRASHRFVAGVAGGLADHYRTRPIWFRLLFAASVFSAIGQLGGGLMDPYGNPDIGGLWGVVALVAVGATAAYFLLWWLVPREDLPESAAQRLARRYPSAGRWPGLILLGIGLAVLLAQLGVWRGDVVIAFALIGAGVLLYRREESPPAPLVEPAQAPRAETGEPTPTQAAAITQPTLRPRERSALGWMTIGVAMLVVGGALIWANAADATPRLVTIPALALLVLSAGLLVGTLVGRARWLVLPAILLVQIVLMTSVVRLPLEGRFGDLNLYPRTPAELDAAYRVSAGGIYIDLRQFQGLHGALPLSASSVFGDVRILLPYDAHVIVDAHTGYGNVYVPGTSHGGLEISLSGRSDPRWGDGMTFDLTLETGIGTVSVSREYPTRRQLRQLRAQQRANG